MPEGARGFRSNMARFMTMESLMFSGGHKARNQRKEVFMLVLSRKKDKKIVIGDSITHTNL
jgi:hypothetical protein